MRSNHFAEEIDRLGPPTADHQHHRGDEPTGAKGTIGTGGHGSWGEPDLSLLGTGRRPAPAFPLHLLGPWAGWCERKARGASAPVDYVAVALLASVGATIANVRWPQAGAAWAEPPVLWCGEVGPPSSSKSPSMDAAFTLVRFAEDRMAYGFDQVQQEYATLKQTCDARVEAWKIEVRTAVKNGDPPPAMPDDDHTRPGETRMANHAHSTRTPLLPSAGALPPLLPHGAGRQPGPVTAAIRAMRAASPAEVRESVPSEPLRALIAYGAVPPGCFAHPVTKDDLGPHLRPGEFAIIDPADRELVRGELFLVAWAGSSAIEGTEHLALVQAYQRQHACDGEPFTAWWVGSMRNRYSPETTARLVAERRWDCLGWSNGPYCPGILEQQIRGRVVGVLASAFEEPKRVGAGAGL